MAIYVGIKKINQHKNTFYYRVSTDDFGGVLFYIKIDVLRKQVDFFAMDDFRDCLGSVDMTYDTINTKIDLSPANLRSIPYVLTKVRKAMANNNLPEHLDYCA